MAKKQSLKAAMNKAAKKRDLRKKRISTPDNTKEVTEPLNTPINNDPMQDSIVIEVLEILKKLETSNDAYRRVMFLMEHHLRGCKENTGEILIEDIDYSINLAMRCVEFSIK
jgi:hypothetical protein